MAKTLFIITGAVGEQLNFPLLRGNGSQKDLTGATVTLQVNNTKGTQQSSRAMTVVDATTGLARYTTVASDFTEALSPYAARIKIVNGGVTDYSEEFSIQATTVKQA